MWLSERHVPQKQKMFHCVHAYLAINGYTETEVAWVGKAPVPYETIHSSIHPSFHSAGASFLLLLFLLFHLSQGMSVVGEKGTFPMAARLCKGEVGERKRENS